MRKQFSYRCRSLAAIAACILFASEAVTFAAISWDGQGASNWWFDPVNWSAAAPGAVAPYFVPPSNNGLTSTDTNINNGWNFAGDGVVYDPVNDPFYAALDPNTDYDYPTEADERFDRETIWRLYITTSAASTHNKLTIKSGTLEVINDTSLASPGGNVQLGRGGMTPGQRGLIVQTGGRFLVQEDNLDIGNFNGSSGNGEYHYFGGTLEAGLQTDAATNRGIRLSAGGSGGSAASGYFGVHNGGAAGHIRAEDFVVGAFLDATLGTTNSVSTVEFFANEDGTRPVQVTRNLSINHQDDSAGAGSRRSAVLKLSLDAPPSVDGGVPLDMGLFAVDGLIAGQSGIFYDDSIANGGLPYSEGSLISATYLGSTYTWSISYTGNITFADPNSSDISSITGAGSGNDVVLMGVSSEIVGIPGDFDGDQDVDGIDFLKWQRGETPGNGSPEELDDWEGNYGLGGLTGIAAVPEPASGVLSLTFACFLANLRRRDSRK